MGMYLFALVMIVLNVAAFGPGVFNSAQAREKGDPRDAKDRSCGGDTAVIPVDLSPRRLYIYPHASARDEYGRRGQNRN